MESFLHTESWETYLTRMAQETVWGDHMVLQVCFIKIRKKWMIFI